jgi:hypothetical protein
VTQVKCSLRIFETDAKVGSDGIAILIDESGALELRDVTDIS